VSADVQLSHRAALYDIELGLMDACIEHQLATERFDSALDLLVKYETLTGLMSGEIERLCALANSAPISKPVETVIKSRGSALKRKLDDEKQPANPTAVKGRRPIKRARITNQDKENQALPVANDGIPTRVLRSRRIVLADVGNTLANKTRLPSEPLVVAQPSTSTAPTTMTALGSATIFANILARHTHRISYSGCTRMIELCMGGAGEKPLVRPNHMCLAATLESVIRLVQSERFLDFAVKVTERKLDELTTGCVYDPEGLTPVGLFDKLTAIWRSYMQRVNGTDESGHGIYSTGDGNRYSVRYHQRTFKLLQQARNIWSIVSERFDGLKARLVGVKTPRYVPVCMGDDPSEALLYKKFIFNCLVNKASL
jgi:hypothetical protein